jgi:hypothetical protein
MEKTDQYIQGTVAELVANGSLSVNGKAVGQPEMSVLARLGFAQEVGTVERPEGTRGRAAKIYRLPTNGSFAVVRK